ncbi:MAG: hypothetical protein M4D80_37865, partial [Myxococcota bacterium]|nr:hypothetical protein [Myxococcota bacterium]
MITIIGTLLIVLATIGVGLLADRKWGVLPRKEKLLAAGRRPQLPGHAPGEAPATAIDVSAGELEKLRRKKCDACRGETDALADDHVTYDGHDLLV